jgi:hypothetical protein
MNVNLISKISKRLSDNIKNIKDCNKKYKETNEESWNEMKKKYILELALDFINLEHEFDYKILYHFKKKDIKALENICNKCMTLYKIESNEERNIKAFDKKEENINSDMINYIDTSLLNLENNINKILETYSYNSDKELNKLNEKDTLIKSTSDIDNEKGKIVSLKNFIKQTYENFTKKPYDITYKINYYENKYTKIEYDFYKEREEDSMDKLILELENFQSIRNSEDANRVFGAKTLERVDEIIHFSNKLITLKNEINETIITENFDQKDAANNLRSMIAAENKTQDLEQ